MCLQIYLERAIYSYFLEININHIVVAIVMLLFESLYYSSHISYAEGAKNMQDLHFFSFTYANTHTHTRIYIYIYIYTYAHARESSSLNISYNMQDLNGELFMYPSSLSHSVFAQDVAEKQG